MNPLRPQLLAAIAAVSLLATDRVAAQTPISGAQTGTLAAGVYNAVGTLSVPAGQTLTLSAGVIIKFVGSHQVNLSGTVHFLGTAYEPVVFTDDKSVCPDSEAFEPRGRVTSATPSSRSASVSRDAAVPLARCQSA